MKLSKWCSMLSVAAVMGLAVAVVPPGAPAQALSCTVVSSDRQATSTQCVDDGRGNQHRVRVVCERGSAAYVYYGAWKTKRLSSAAFCPSGYTVVQAGYQTR